MWSVELSRAEPSCAKSEMDELVFGGGPRQLFGKCSVL